VHVRTALKTLPKVELSAEMVKRSLLHVTFGGLGGISASAFGRDADNAASIAGCASLVDAGAICPLEQAAESAIIRPVESNRIVFFTAMSNLRLKHRAMPDSIF
jgi:hypothetical protein